MAFLCAARWVGEVFLVRVRLCTGPRLKTRCEAIGGGEVLDVVPDAISGAETSERAEGAPDAQGVLYSKSHADAAGVETQDQNAKPETLSTIPQANTEAGDGATELPDVGL